jgi:hypothetical protein
VNEAVSLHLHGVENFAVRIFFEQKLNLAVTGIMNFNSPLDLLVKSNCPFKSASIVWLRPHVPPAALTKGFSVEQRIGVVVGEDAQLVLWRLFQPTG